MTTALCITLVFIDGYSSDESTGEQGMVEGLSEFMAEALRVVSAPDAFLQRE